MVALLHTQSSCSVSPSKMATFGFDGVPWKRSIMHCVCVTIYVTGRCARVRLVTSSTRWHGCRYVTGYTKARQLSRRICHAAECCRLTAGKWLIAADSPSDQGIGLVQHAASPTRRPQTREAWTRRFFPCQSTPGLQIFFCKKTSQPMWKWPKVWDQFSQPICICRQNNNAVNSRSYWKSGN